MRGATRDVADVPADPTPAPGSGGGGPDEGPPDEPSTDPGRPPGGGAPRLGGRRRVVALVAVLALVVGVVAVLAVVRDRDDPIEGEAALEGLVAAWERYRMGTFVVESEWRRTMRADGRTLYSATFLAQRPPDRVQRQHGSVRGQLNGNPIYCGTGPDGTYGCTPAARPAPDHRATVEDELEAWRSYTVGAVPLYEVRHDGDECFTLQLVRVDFPDPPYGREAELCFDEATGALRLLRRELPTAVEVQEAVAIRTEVGPADFSLEQDDAYLGEPEIPEEELLGTEPVAPVGGDGG